MSERQEFFLSVSKLATGYAGKQVLYGVSLNAIRGQVVALIGHNGSGKSSLLKAIVGLLPCWQGEIIVAGQRLVNHSPMQMLERKVAYVPQGAGIFRSLTVKENLEMNLRALRSRKALKREVAFALSRFPILAPRLKQVAGSLSGGEAQTLALASVLMLSPQLLLLDEPSMGLAPDAAASALDQVRALVLESGMTALIVEQRVREVLSIADCVCVLRNGRVSFSGGPLSLREPAKLKEFYL